MKLLFSACIVLCLAGVVYSQAAGEDCGAGDACADDLNCQDSKCRSKIGADCTANDANQCPPTAGACPAAAPVVCTCPYTTFANTDNSMCLTKEDADCSGSDAECLADATCSAGKCACANNYTPNTDKTKCLKNAGQSCTETAECIANAECTGETGSKTCSCKSGYTANGNNECAANVGTTCAVTADCLANGMCNTDMKCECNTNYVASYSDNMCKKAPGQTCSANECGENAECDATCKCKDGYNNKDNGRCGKKVGETCTASPECVDNAECTTGDPKECKCMSDYSADDGFCSGASAVVSSLLLLLAALVIPSWI